MNFRHIFIVSLLFATTARAADILPAEEVDRMVKPVMDGQWAKAMVVGLITKHGRQVIGYGRLSDQDATTPDGQTVFEIGSVSKTFTATLLADAAVHGDLALEDPVQKYLPADVKAPTGKDGKAITLLHLTTHSSGLPRMPGNFAPADAGNPYADYTLRQMYDFLSGFRLPREPGESCEYSNFGVALLGNVLALHANKSYEDLLLGKICKPLGMNSTRITFDDSMRKRLALPYNAEGDPLKTWDLPTFAGAGGIRSTADDMLSYVAAEIGLTKSDLDPAIALTHKQQRQFDKAHGIGMGWFITPTRNSVWHNGQTGGYHANVNFDPDKHVGVVVLSTTTSALGDDVATRLLLRLRGQPAEPPKPRLAVAVAPAIIDRYVGEYKFAMLSWMTIRKADDHLTAQLTGQNAFRIFPESETKFFWKIVDAQLTFNVDANGNVTGLVLHQNGRDMPAEKTK